MVLLGDNYFAECSCFHACSIIERRILCTFIYFEILVTRSNYIFLNNLLEQ
ncbi:unnamed protein product [Thelazia callipaeda]|uniref:Uncharacterized protein n=1 Tax=Thelazia callipaeda TaxID=103827 RepID=A0A0N5CQD3_THECL|nr:unnamed protein product [Thelazia callipaeda]